MIDGVPDFATYDPGADSASNASRRQGVRAPTVHTTQGNDSRSLGKNRKHNSPGTFNFLNRDDGIYCYYPAYVRCSHAAGSNYSGPGIENEGFVGQPLTPNQIRNLGLLARWLHDTYGVPLSLYDGPRIWVDGSSFAGFVNHNSVQTEPQYRHTDRIPPNEWASAIGTAPSPVPSKKRVPMLWIAVLPIAGTSSAQLVNPGGVYLSAFTGPMNQFGVPQDAADYAETNGVGIKFITVAEHEQFKKRTAQHFHA